MFQDLCFFEGEDKDDEERGKLEEREMRQREVRSGIETGREIGGDDSGEVIEDGSGGVLTLCLSFCLL